MSRRDDRISLTDMRIYATKAIDMMDETSLGELEQDAMMQFALIKLVEIVGEAAYRVSEETQQQHTEIAWGEIIGTRNRMVHGSDTIDLSILWNIIRNDLPPLIEQRKALFGEGA